MKNANRRKNETRRTLFSCADMERFQRNTNDESLYKFLNATEKFLFKSISAMERREFPNFIFYGDGNIHFRFNSEIEKLHLGEVSLAEVLDTFKGYHLEVKEALHFFED